MQANSIQLAGNSPMHFFPTRFVPFASFVRDISEVLTHTSSTAMQRGSRPNFGEFGYQLGCELSREEFDHHVDVDRQTDVGGVRNGLHGRGQAFSIEADPLQWFAGTFG